MKVSVTFEGRFTVVVTDHWSEACTIDQVKKQAADAARVLLTKHETSANDHKVIVHECPKLVSVTIHEEPRA